MFRGFGELVGVNLERRHARVARQLLVEHRQLAHDTLFGLLVGQPLYAPLLVVGVHERYDASVAVKHNRLAHKGQLVQLGLDLLGIYVLA